MVGVTSDRAELIEIENIVKVFIVTERVIDLASEIKSEVANKKNFKSIKKININPDPYNKLLKPLTVRGFN